MSPISFNMNIKRNNLSWSKTFQNCLTYSAYAIISNINIKISTQNQFPDAIETVRVFQFKYLEQNFGHKLLQVNVRNVMGEKRHYLFQLWFVLVYAYVCWIMCLTLKGRGGGIMPPPNFKTSLFRKISPTTLKILDFS